MTTTEADKPIYTNVQRKLEGKVNFKLESLKLTPLEFNSLVTKVRISSKGIQEKYFGSGRAWQIK